jgi:hypothetical protein
MSQTEQQRPAGDGGTSASYDPCVEPAGLGVRTVGSDATSGELLDVLCVTRDLGDPAAIESRLRARAERFAPSALTGLSPVVRIGHADDGRLEVWSRRAEGFRLSAVLEWTEATGVTTPLEAALTVGDRLLGALASLQQADSGTGASGHGAIAVDQVVIDEHGALTLTDHAFGDVLSQVQLTRDRLWQRFRIAMPPAAGLARFDHRVDVTQAAVVICALLLGRVPRADEYPRDLPALVAEAVRRSCSGAPRTDWERLGAWLRAATELEPRNAFRSAAAARQALGAAFAARIGDDGAVRRWLRAARGLEEQASSVPASAPAVIPASPPGPPAAAGEAVSWVRRFRGWLQER